MFQDQKNHLIYVTCSSCTLLSSEMGQDQILIECDLSAWINEIKLNILNFADFYTDAPNM